MANILIIEDDPSMQNLYKRVFVMAGHEVRIATNGVEGLEEVRKLAPELIFLDIMMPKMNGMQVLDELKKNTNTKDIPVVMLTNVSSGTLQTAEEAVKKGALRYIIKSDTEPEEVIEIAKKILESR